MVSLIWLVILLPLCGAIVNGLIGRKLPKVASAAIGCGSVAAAFVTACGAFVEMMARSPESRVFHESRLFEWISAGGLETSVRFLLDPLSMLMTLVVTGVGLFIHIYSAGYMEHDESNWSDHGARFARYFTFLNLFMASMLTLVLADNYILLFVGWEGVGLCSYLLIGFWFERPSAVEAGKKAFIVNRVGDLGFAIGLFILFRHVGSLSFDEVFQSAKNFVSETVRVGPYQVPLFWIVSLLLFVGATGKSAQIPLYVWLPDAMEGPTPVSALIHAATMVTAGVYMVARSHVLFDLGARNAPFGLAPLTVVAIIGVATLLLSATIGLVQYDIKRVLAYSTVSQLGYMFLGCGAGAYAAAIFHLYTHAFFKALLFLGSGSVIHAMEHAFHHGHTHPEPQDGIPPAQDMRNMGGLRNHMKITHVTFVIGALALAGCPLLAGFFSKDAILTAAFEKNPIFWILGLLGAVMTAFYMTRQVLMVFYGEERVSNEVKSHLSETSPLMTIPLIVLSFGAIGAGWVWLPGRELFADFLNPVLHKHEEHANLVLMFGMSIAAATGGFVGAMLLYGPMAEKRLQLKTQMAGLYRLLFNKWYVDELYNNTVVRAGYALSDLCAWLIDVLIIDGLFVNGSAGLVSFIGSAFRNVQTSYVRNYALGMVIGGVIIVTYFVFR